MKLLQSSVLLLALLLVACEEAVSPTEPQLIESTEVDAIPEADGPEILQPKERPQGDEPG